MKQLIQTTKNLTYTYSLFKVSDGFRLESYYIGSDKVIDALHWCDSVDYSILDLMMVELGVMTPNVSEAA